MAAPVVELADAIVADVNDVARAWSLTFTAERSWVPLWIGKEELTTSIGCKVNPWPIADVQNFERDRTVTEYSIDIGLAKRLSANTEAEIDGLVLQVENLRGRYEKTNMVVVGVGTFVALRRLDEYVMFNPEMLSYDPASGGYTGDFLSFFRVPYRFIEAV